MTAIPTPAEVESLRPRPTRPAEEYVCSSCLATIRNWQEMEEFQHAECGGLVRLRVEIDLDHAISENLAFNIKVSKEINEYRARLARIEPVFEAAKAHVARVRRERRETAEINERLNRGEAVSWTTTVSSTPTTWDLEDAIDAALAEKEQG